VDDMASASIFVMELEKATYDQHTESMQSHINVGFESDITIAQLAREVSNATGYKGKISFDSSKPDGAPRKWMESIRINQLGWEATIDLNKGLSLAYENFTQLHG